jgi:recombination protein RecR
MLGLPRPLTELIHRLTRLPGVGPKAAERMALALLKWDPAEVEGLALALSEAADGVGACPQCGCLAEAGELCSVCADGSRDGALLCVVETALDAIALERGGDYSGRYHVLGGALSPLRGVLPEDLRIADLLSRIRDERVGEVIVATNASPDGEATALYLKQVLTEYADEHLGLGEGSVDHADPGQRGDSLGGVVPRLRVTRLARGLPSGAQLDYADSATLHSALEHRTEM